jgi:uncharacterized membrane protein
MPKSKGTEPRFHWRDLAEIAVGACVMAFPVAVTEEVWDLGKELALSRVLLFALASLFFLSITIYVLHGHLDSPPTWKTFLLRVASTYGVTLLISALLLIGIDRFDLLQDPLIALNRAVLVAFPASFAATAVDSFADNSKGRSDASS